MTPADARLSLIREVSIDMKHNDRVTNFKAIGHALTNSISNTRAHVRKLATQG
jgi:hypothetical protein